MLSAILKNSYWTQRKGRRPALTKKMGEYKQRQGEHFSHQTIINTLDVDDCILYFFGLCI